NEFHAAAAELGDVGHRLTAITHPRQRPRTFQALLRAALFRFQPDLRVPFCFPPADRAELLFGDQEAHHVFPVVGLSFQPLTIHLSLGITHLAAHIVFGLNLGHGGEPTTAWPIGANTSATIIHHEYPGPPAQRAAPTHFMLTRRATSYVPRGQSVQIVDRTTSPVAGPHHPRGDANLAFATTVVKSSCRLRVSTPRFLSHPNIPMASPHSPRPLPPHRAHTPPSPPHHYFVVPTSFRAHQSPHTHCTALEGPAAVR